MQERHPDGWLHSLAVQQQASGKKTVEGSTSSIEDPMKPVILEHKQWSW